MTKKLEILEEICDLLDESSSNDVRLAFLSLSYSQLIFLRDAIEKQIKVWRAWNVRMYEQLPDIDDTYVKGRVIRVVCRTEIAQIEYAILGGNKYEYRWFLLKHYVTDIAKWNKWAKNAKKITEIPEIVVDNS